MGSPQATVEATEAEEGRGLPAGGRSFGAHGQRGRRARAIDDLALTAAEVINQKMPAAAVADADGE